MFRSKPEAYLQAISVLSELNQSLKNPVVSKCIRLIKKEFENHQQNPAVICHYLKILRSKVDFHPDQEKQLNQLSEAILQNPYTQTDKEKFRNPLPRRAESEFATTLLLHPTKKMMEAVKRVSDEIIKIMRDIKENGSREDRKYLLSIPSKLDPQEKTDAFGAFTEKPTFRGIVKLLKQNDARQLAEIMLIHVRFGQHVFRHVPIRTAPHRPPTGELHNIIKDYWHEAPEDFFKKGIAIPDDELGYQCRSLISDTIMYASALYSADEERGRKHVIPIATQQMGLMLPSQVSKDFPLPMHASSWIADCLSTRPDPHSRVVQDAIQNDGVYVSGPSGLTSVLLGQMEIIANFENEALKQHYLCAVMAYIVSGGLHSMHEVLAPAAYCLKLLPGYNAFAPDTKEGKLAPAPNYHIAFRLFAKIDPEFYARTQKAWKNLMTYFHASYASNDNGLFAPKKECEEKTITPQLNLK